MRLRTVRLFKFKRFDDLTIDLGSTPKKIVALVGPNGCGKSSIFDAFENLLREYVGSNVSSRDTSYYNKAHFDEINPSIGYDKRQSIQISNVDDRPLKATSFYIRTAYRFTPNLKVEVIKQQTDAILDTTRPGSSNDLDQRLQSNYERLLSQMLQDFFAGLKTGADYRAEFIDKINNILNSLLGLKVSSLGDVSKGKGQLYFEKGSSKNFPFENLSSGEKEVIDIIIDLIVKTPIFDDTIYCIDEPELHLNTAIQRKLIIEISRLIPDTCQLWIATHSVGFLRALQTDLKDDVQVLDFSEKEYHTGVQQITPISPSRNNWQRIFSTALEDLTGLIAPRSIIYCEGRPEPTVSGNEQGLDAVIYNRIFEQEYPEHLFVSSGGGNAQGRATDIALKILSKAFDDVELLLLKDMDRLTEEERKIFLSTSPLNRMLRRHEIENYLVDYEIVEKLGLKNAISINRSDYDTLINDVKKTDCKPLLQRIGQLCGHQGDIVTLRHALSALITPDTSVYKELKECIL